MFFYSWCLKKDSILVVKVIIFQKPNNQSWKVCGQWEFIRSELTGFEWHVWILISSQLEMNIFLLFHTSCQPNKLLLFSIFILRVAIQWKKLMNFCQMVDFSKVVLGLQVNKREKQNVIFTKSIYEEFIKIAIVNIKHMWLSSIFKWMNIFRITYPRRSIFF